MTITRLARPKDEPDAVESPAGAAACPRSSNRLGSVSPSPPMAPTVNACRRERSRTVRQPIVSRGVFLIDVVCSEFGQRPQAPCRRRSKLSIDLKPDTVRLVSLFDLFGVKSLKLGAQGVGRVEAVEVGVFFG